MSLNQVTRRLTALQDLPPTRLFSFLSVSYILHPQCSSQIQLPLLLRGPDLLSPQDLCTSCSLCQSLLSPPAASSSTLRFDATPLGCRPQPPNSSGTGSPPAFPKLPCFTAHHTLLVAPLVGPHLQCGELHFLLHLRGLTNGSCSCHLWVLVGWLNEQMNRP